MTRIEYLRDRAEAIGLHLDTWSPGDGVTRYRFGTRSADYFGMDAVFTALGIKEAETWLAGAEFGRRAPGPKGF